MALLETAFVRTLRKACPMLHSFELSSKYAQRLTNTEI